MKDFGYPKHEKLKQKKEISLLFEQGKWMSCGNLRVIYFNSDVPETPEITSFKIGVSASKRNFKKATDRNRIKRLLRESYRLNKMIYRETFGENSLSMVFWASNKFPKNYAEVEAEFLKLCKSKK